jgi:hypothetical protein
LVDRIGGTIDGDGVRCIADGESTGHKLAAPAARAEDVTFIDRKEAL